MPDMHDRIERIRVKQNALRNVKESLGFNERSQGDFDGYMNSLQPNETCKFMTGISGVISLCNNMHDCRFKGEIYCSAAGKPKHECQRERVVRIENIFAA